MTSSFHIKNVDKFVDFLSDIDYNSKADIFRDVISLTIDQCESRRTQSPPAAQRK